MNNEKHEVTKEEAGEELWKCFKLDAKKHRTRNYDKTYNGISQCLTVRQGHRYQVTQNSKNNDDIMVEKYDTLFH